MYVHILRKRHQTKLLSKGTDMKLTISCAKRYIWWLVVVSTSIYHTSFGVSSKVVLITIPKSGTHHIEKCTALLYARAKNRMTWAEERIYIEKINLNPYFDNIITYFDTYEKKHENIALLSISGHILFDPKLAAELLKRKYKVILNIRDPRDQTVSSVYWAEQMHALDPNLFPEVTQYSHTDLIPLYFTSAHKGVGVDGYYHQFLPWLKYPNVLLVKFEHLVGPRGGGSYTQQQREIRRIARHLGLKLSNDNRKKIAGELFGGTATFRQGKIGSWKQEFTQAHKEIFKNIPGAQQLLMQLGYEKDTSW